MDAVSKSARTCIISPHLDDAALSAYAALADPAAGERQVITAVTHGTAGNRTNWTTRTGFADSAIEHSARRDEDSNALAQVGARVVHLGGVAGDRRSICASIDSFVQSNSEVLRQSVIFLPAGTGRQTAIVEYVWRRLTRKYDPRGPHPEHVLVRDTFEICLRAAGIRTWGYYAELPYAQHEALEACRRRLVTRCGYALRIVTRTPDAAAKLRVAQCYASQVPLAIGITAASRLSFCDQPETLFIPVSDMT